MSQETATFNPRTVVALVAAGIVAFAAFLLLLAYAGDFRGGDGRPNILSSSAVGFKGVATLIERTGGRVRLLRDAATSADTEDLVVVTLEPRVSAEALDEFLEQRGPRATLFVFPKYAVHPHEKREGWVRTHGHLRPDVYGELLDALGDPAVFLRASGDERLRTTGVAEGLSPRLPRAYQAMRGGRVKPLIATGSGDIILGQLGEGPRYLLAEPDLLNNRGLAHVEGARTALELVAALNSTDAESVSFELTLNGYGAGKNLLKLALEPPFLPLTVAIFAAALLAGLHGAGRFGPEERDARAIALGKAALVENSAALFRIARREHAAGGAYAEAVKEAAVRESGAQAIGDHGAEAYLDRISPADGPKFSALAARAAAARDRSELLAAARALFDWKRGLIK